MIVHENQIKSKNFYLHFLIEILYQKPLAHHYYQLVFTSRVVVSQSIFKPKLSVLNFGGIPWEQVIIRPCGKN